MVSVYGPLVYGWCRQSGVAEHESADVGQEVFRAVAVGIERFRREKPGDTFVGWLRQITKFKIADYQRAAVKRPAAHGGSTFLGVLGNLPGDVTMDDVTSTELAGSLLSQERKILVARALEVLESCFQPKTWQAFWGTAVDGRPTADVAIDLQMTTIAVRKAKSRVLRRLREEFGGLIDEEAA